MKGDGFLERVPGAGKLSGSRTSTPPGDGGRPREPLPETKGLPTAKARGRGPDIDFWSLEVFTSLADSLCFRETAEQLHTAQPAVTARIAQLEKSLGVRLFERDRRQVILTPKGREFLDYAEQLLRTYHDMIDAVCDRSAVRGTVRLGVSESVVHTWLPTLFARVKATYPNLLIDLQEVDVSPRLRERLIAKELDLAFLLGPINHKKVVSRELCSFPVAFMAGDNIPLPQGSIALEHIVKFPLITFAHNTQPYLALRQLLAPEWPRATIIPSASLEAVVRLVLEGYGIAVIPPAVIEKKVDAREKLRRLNTEIELPPLNYFVGWPDKPENPAAQKVAEIAIQVAGEMPKSETA
jgi:DNA-binding transcriptional LysR family regulator